MLSTNPDLVLVALGCPKQKILMHRWYKQGTVQVMLGIGASLDFLAGNVKRAPQWMSDTGLEWLYRLSQDPKRLSKRYLVQDIGILRLLPVYWKLLEQSEFFFRVKVLQLIF